MAAYSPSMTGMTQTVRAKGVYWQSDHTDGGRPEWPFLIFSLGLHIAVLLMATGQFSLFSNKDDMEEMIVVEMVDAPIDDITSPPLVKPEPLQPKPATPPKTEVTKTKPATPPKSEAKPEPPQQTPPAEEMQAEEAAEDTVPLPREAASPEAELIKPPMAKPVPPKREEAPAEKPKEKPAEEAKAMDFQSVLKNLAGEEAAPQAEENKEAEDKPLRRAPTLTQPPPVSDQVSQTEMQALINQLAGCWNILPGARNAENLYVDVYLVVNPDRTVQQARIVDQSRYNNDSFFRAAADSALRALRAPACSPLNLPPFKYEQWKNMTVRFDPKRMF